MNRIAQRRLVNTKQLCQAANDIQGDSIDASELEEKRLHAMEQLYGKGEVHDK